MRTQEDWFLPVSISENSRKEQEASKGQPVGREDEKNDDGLKRVLGFMDSNRGSIENERGRVRTCRQK